MLTLFRNVTFPVVKDITVTLAAKIAGVSSPQGDPSSDAGAGHQAWSCLGNKGLPGPLDNQLVFVESGWRCENNSLVNVYS